jgi:integrase
MRGPSRRLESRELDEWLRGLNLAPASRFNYRKVLRTAFEFAVLSGYATTNPVLKTAKIKVTHGEPGILTPQEMSALLNGADPKIVPALAISAFAGLRDAEVGRLTWDRVDLVGGHIKIDAGIAKTATRRLIPISRNLRAWLTPYATTAGPVRPAWRVSYLLYRSARKAASVAVTDGISPQSDLDEKWPSNALRHSFVSYRLALLNMLRRLPTGRTQYSVNEGKLS